MKSKITVRSVEAIQPSDKDQIIWDTEVPGFGCKVTPKGRRSYFLYYRTRDGQQRRPAIGQHGALKPEAARAIAKQWAAEVANGSDPSLAKKTDRTSPTVRDLCDRYIEEHAETRKKATSIYNDKRIIKAHILPAIGSRKAASVARPDISSIHHSLRATPYEANRMLALTSKMFSLAERWGIRPDNTNPAKNIDRFPEKKRERYLCEAELRELWEVLGDHETRKIASDGAIAAIKLLILTGRRLSEILALKWEWIDFANKVMSFPDTKNGALTVAISEATASVLAELGRSRGTNPFVIKGRRADKPLVNIQKPWRAIRSRAGLEDVRIHDLRHTYASIGAGLGISLPMLGRLLGHTQQATTSRYAHLAQHPVQVAAETIGAAIEEAVLRKR